MKEHDLRPAELRDVHLREVTVRTVEDITPGMRRITFAGPQLHTHQRFDGATIPPFHSTGFDDHIRMIFPDPQTGLRPDPELKDTGGYHWTEEVRALMRAYTVRHWDADSGELTVDFARHQEGVAEEWSARAQPGDVIAIAGPRHCHEFPHAAQRLVLVGDATSLPAMERAMESAPAQLPITMFCEVPDAHFIVDYAQPNVEAHWVVYGDQDTLVDVFRRHLLGEDTPQPCTYFWAAGESHTLRDVRRILKEAGVEKQWAEFSGYWSRPSVTDEA